MIKQMAVFYMGAAIFISKIKYLDGEIYQFHQILKSINSSIISLTLYSMAGQNKNFSLFYFVSSIFS